MRKRERENPCGICGHYHNHEEGEICGICGHRVPDSSETFGIHASAFATEILPDFLYLGSYDNASRSELLKAQGISHILNTVPACQNLYKNSFTYHCLQDENTLLFDDAINFLDKCENEKARVLVHCMLGKNRSAAVVVAYLMKRKGWKLAQSFQWVKDRRPLVEISEGVYRQLLDYEQQIFVTAAAPPADPLSFAFGFSNPGPGQAVPNFNPPSSGSIFNPSNSAALANNFTFTASNMSQQLGEKFSGTSMDST